MIDRVEIVKGGGVESVRSRRGRRRGEYHPHEPLYSSNSALVRFEDMDGTTNYSASFNADVLSGDGLTAATIFGQGDQLDSYDRNGDDFTEIGERKSTAFGMRATRELPQKGRMTLDYSRTFEDRRGGDKLDKPPFNAEIAEWVRSWRNSVSVGWDQPWTESLSTRLSLAHAQTDRKTYYGGGGDQNAYGLTDNPLSLVDAQFNYGLDAHALTWGVQYSSDELEDRQPPTDRLTNEKYTNAGFYVQDDWTVDESLSIVPGVRLDEHSELDDAVFSPRVAVRYEPIERLVLRGSFSTGFLAPLVFDEDLHIALSGGEAQVISQRRWPGGRVVAKHDAGFRGHAARGHGYGRFELTGFRTDLEDAFSLTESLDDPETDEMELTRINSGEATVQGIEASIGWMNNHFETQLGWVLQSAEYDEHRISVRPTSSGPPTATESLQARLTLPEVRGRFPGHPFMGEEKLPHYAGYIAEDRLETTDTFVVIDLSVKKDPAGGRRLDLADCRRQEHYRRVPGGHGPGRRPGHRLSVRTSFPADVVRHPGLRLLMPGGVLVLASLLATSQTGCLGIAGRC